MASKKQENFTPMAAFADAMEVPILDLTVAAALQNKNFTITQLKALIASELGSEGTWTPVITFGGASVGITYTGQAGTFTKIGRIAFCTCLVVLSSKGSSNGTALITGLPFTVLNDANVTQTFGVASHVKADAATLITFSPTINSTNVAIYKDTGGSLADDSNFIDSTSFRINFWFLV